MTRKEFLSEIIGYWGNFQNESVLKQFARILAKIQEKDLDKIFDWLLENVPVTYTLDVKTLLSATKACFIGFVDEKKNCPICNASLNKAAGVCWHCGYDYTQTPEEFRASLVPADQVFEELKKVYSVFAAKAANLKKSLHNDMPDM